MKKANVMIILIVFLIVTLIGCSPGGDNQPEVPPPNGEPKEGKPMDGVHLVVAVNAENAPGESVNAKGEFVGFSIELQEMLSEMLGFTYEWKDMEFFGLIAAVEGGQADMINSSISVTKERSEKVDFTIGYYTPITCIISAKGSGIETIDDLKGKKVGAASGTTFERLVKTLDGVQLISFDSAVPAAQILGTRELDAIIESSSFGLEHGVPRGHEVHVIPFETLGGFVPPYGMAFTKGSPYVKYFNEALEKLEAEGILEDLKYKYYGEDYVEKLRIAQGK